MIFPSAKGTPGKPCSSLQSHTNWETAAEQDLTVYALYTYFLTDPSTSEMCEWLQLGIRGNNSIEVHSLFIAGNNKNTSYNPENDHLKMEMHVFKYKNIPHCI
jgi:hypothetical protein